MPANNPRPPLPGIRLKYVHDVSCARSILALRALSGARVVPDVINAIRFEAMSMCMCTLRVRSVPSFFWLSMCARAAPVPRLGRSRQLLFFYVQHWQLASKIRSCVNTAGF